MVVLVLIDAISGGRVDRMNNMAIHTKVILKQ